MKICIAQIPCIAGDVEINCARISAVTKQAKANGSYMVVFPEMIDTGYEINAIKDKASTWPGKPYDTASGAARDNSIFLVCGLSEREKGKIYNSIAVFDPGGSLIAKYRKIHLMPLDPINEDKYLKPGKTPEVVRIGGMTWGLMICYDLRFPDLSRQLLAKGAEALIICSAWPEPRRSHWEILTSARAVENQCYVIASNRVGTDGSFAFCGSSRIINPNGNVISAASSDEQELLFAELTSEAVTSVRARLPFVKNMK